MEFHRKRGLYDNKNARKVRNQDLFKLIKQRVNMVSFLGAK